LGEVDVRGRDDTAEERPLGECAHRPKCTRLEHAEQLRLQRRLELRDLVEEE
jgi:hypothetical protein